MIATGSSKSRQKFVHSVYSCTNSVAAPRLVAIPRRHEDPQHHRSSDTRRGDRSESDLTPQSSHSVRVRLDGQALAERVAHERASITSGISRNPRNRKPPGTRISTAIVSSMIVRGGRPGPELSFQKQQHDQPQRDHDDDRREAHPIHMPGLRRGPTPHRLRRTFAPLPSMPSANQRMAMGLPARVLSMPAVRRARRARFPRIREARTL